MLPLRRAYAPPAEPEHQLDAARQDEPSDNRRLHQHPRMLTAAVSAPCGRLGRPLAGLPRSRPPGIPRAETVGPGRAGHRTPLAPGQLCPAHPVNAPGVTARSAIVLATAGNEHRVEPDTGDTALNVLTDILGAVEVIAVGPVDSPLPVTGHCSSCGLSTTRYGPAGSPLCDRCQDGIASRPAQDVNDALPDT